MYSKEIEDKIEYYKKRNMLIHKDLYRIKIEASLGCSKDCGFCGMTRKESLLMSMETFDLINKQIPNTVKRVEFILHGEPTLNKNLPLFFTKIKDNHPKTQITLGTNGWRFLEKQYDPDYFFSLYDHGANVVQVSLYTKEEFDLFAKLVKENKDRFEEYGIILKDLYKSHDNMFKYKGNKNRTCLFVREYEGLNSGKCMQRRFHTFGGNIPHEKWKNYNSKYSLKDFPLTGKGKTCTSLLKYLSIGSNGDYYLCCRDASHTVIFGNVRDLNMVDFWKSEDIQVFRYILKKSRRDLIAPCFLCSRFCYRDPLYPYYGKPYSLDKCLETVNKYSKLREDVLFDNLIDYSKIKEIPEHLIDLIERSSEK